MTCEVVRTYLSEFMDGALPEGLLADIHEHFDGCLSCRDVHDTLSAAGGFYSASGVRRVPENYRESLRRRLEDAAEREVDA